MAGASMTVVFVQDTYPYTGIGESNSAGLRVHMCYVPSKLRLATPPYSRANVPRG